MNFIDLGAPRGSSERMPTWFKIEASNNDENWTLLLERASITRWRDGETRQYYIDNSTAYKFYKFTPTEFRIARFRLYRYSKQRRFRKIEFDFVLQWFYLGRLQHDGIK
jgi:hypothetical protein